jgi:DNA-binding beta-propeller fold protein YncE
MTKFGWYALRRLLCIVAAGTSLPVASPLLAAQDFAPLELTKTIAMPGVRGRIDHLDIDLSGERLFVAALGNNTVEIIDLRAGAVSVRLESLREPQGVAFVPKTGKVFVGNGGGDVSVFSGTPLRATGKIVDLEDADNVRLDGAATSLYVGYGRALAVIDANAHAIAARIPLAGHPESFQLEPDDPRVFVNVPSAGQIAVVDRGKREQVATWPVADAAANFPMALDAAHHRLFVGTRRPPRLLVHDTDTGKVVAALPISSDVDDLFYDAKRQRIYAICGEGVVNVIEQRDVHQYVTVGEVKTAPGARTGLFVAEHSVLYVAVPARGGSSAEIRAYAVR